jgi:predicted transcriptional regulator
MGKVQTNVRLPEDLYRQLRITAAERGTTQSAIIEDAVREWLRSYAAPVD